MDPAVLNGINEAPFEVWKDFAVAPYEMKGVNGWLNLVDLGTWGKDYRTRGLVAWGGLGALPKEDALYPYTIVDGSGTALDGSHKYVMHFNKGEVPPSKVNVWSVSAYRDNFYMKNSLNRYGVTSQMPLKYNPDGSLDIYLQKGSPGADKESNWLPVPPSGTFNVTVRVYEPEQSLIDGTYKVPPLTRVD